MKRLRWIAWVSAIAGVVPLHAAVAADLGGDCCSDLEDRIAELEATAARKGNRNVSLTITGWVAQQIQWWDDGVKSNTYVTDLTSDLDSHVTFTGQAKINSDVTAGYMLELISSNAEPVLISQDKPDANLGSVSTLQSYWFLKSDTLGKVSVGKVSPTADNWSILVDGSGSLAPGNDVLFEGSSFYMNNGKTRTPYTWGDMALCHFTNLAIGADCNGLPSNAVRYDSPTIAGFAASATWGEDDYWDVGLKYSGQFDQFQVSAAVAYSQTDDPNLFNFEANRRDNYLQAGLYIMHVPTGIFVYGAYGKEDPTNLTAAGNSIPDDHHLYAKVGLREAWIPLGHTVMWGEYAQYNNMTSDALIDAGATSTRIDRWGFGVLQEIDAAAMSVWVKYRNLAGTVDGVPELNHIDDYNTVVAGALINF